MRKPDLAAAIAEKADLTKEQANRVLNAVLEEITAPCTARTASPWLASAPSCNATVALALAKTLKPVSR